MFPHGFPHTLSQARPFLFPAILVLFAVIGLGLLCTELLAVRKRRKTGQTITFPHGGDHLRKAS